MDIRTHNPEPFYDPQDKSFFPMSGTAVEQVEEPVLQIIFTNFEEILRWSAPMGTEEAAEFLKMPMSEFQKVAPSLPRYPRSERRFLYMRWELLQWLRENQRGSNP